MYYNAYLILNKIYRNKRFSKALLKSIWLKFNIQKSRFMNRKQPK